MSDQDTVEDIVAESSKMSELGWSLLIPILGIIKTLIFFAIPIAIGYGLFKVGKRFWIEAKANEWLIVIRNGNLVKSGIGMATFYIPGD